MLRFIMTRGLSPPLIVRSERSLVALMNDDDGNMSESSSEEDTPTLVSKSNRPLISWSVSKGRLPLNDKGAVLEAPSDRWQRTGHKISGESMSSGELGSLDDQFNILAKRQRRSTESEWIPSSWSQHQAWENTFQLFHGYVFPLTALLPSSPSGKQ